MGLYDKIFKPKKLVLANGQSCGRKMFPRAAQLLF